MRLQASSAGQAFLTAEAQSHLHRRERLLTSGSFGSEFLLKVLMVAIFMPEGLSFFIGDFRLSIARAVLIILFIVAITRFAGRASANLFVLMPSDVIAFAAGIWMILAAAITAGPFEGLKGGGAAALEFTGAYYIFRNIPESVGSSVRVMKFASVLIIPIVCLAALDPLTGRLYTYEVVKNLTGYVKMAYEVAMEFQGDTVFRHGVIRAMGPLEHSILFGTVCAWFGTIALWTFPTRFLGWSVAAVAFIGVFISQSQGSLVIAMLAVALAAFYGSTKQFRLRWRVLGTIVMLGIITVFLFSGSPVMTLLRLGGISDETGWNRVAIWETAVPQLMQSPLFGLGLTDDWNWQSNAALSGASIDAMWLELAMMFGIPGSILVFLTMIIPFWAAPLDQSPYLSRKEQRLSTALGFVTVMAVFSGFTVHIWGACWILLGIFSGMRANLLGASIVRKRVMMRSQNGYGGRVLGIALTAPLRQPLRRPGLIE